MHMDAYGREIVVYHFTKTAIGESCIQLTCMNMQ